jgi:hypothetical protein
MLGEAVACSAFLKYITKPTSPSYKKSLLLTFKEESYTHFGKEEEGHTSFH